MKKFALYTLLCATVLASCRKDSSISNPVEKSFPDPAQTLDSFKNVLGSATNGWVGTLKPKDGSQLFSVYFQLDNSKNEVTLYTDNNPASATTPSKSRFGVAISQKINPTLSIGEGSQLADIKLSTKRPVDTAYSFHAVNGDTLLLIGNKYSDELKLIKASAQVKSDYAAGKLGSSAGITNDYISSAAFFGFQPGNTNTMVYFSLENKTSGFAYVNNNARVSSGTGFAYTLTGIALRYPVVIGNQSVSAFTWDDTVKNFYATINNTKVYLTATTVPVIPVHYLLGGEISGQLTVPEPALLPLPGWTADFKAIWTDAATKFKARGLPMSKVVMDFQTDAGILNMNVYFAQYVGKYTFKYTKTADGVYSFVMQPFTTEVSSANGNAVKVQAQPLTDMLSRNRFTLGYVDDPDGLLISFTSVDKPSISFTSFW
ncbi:DUF4302 domain-containing protein [Chitinophaga sp. HK235]|uniref:DUF4302 domain-containing protein n=1 Tax=Chitinophaga sp. HK235 TaxID=2952571 RepID=UPI001BAC405B|nr:DUF4302 domain-containing protein [Chitinophaga sp. HK235]